MIRAGGIGMLELGCLNGRRRRVISGRLITGGKRWGLPLADAGMELLKRMRGRQCQALRKGHRRRQK